MDGVVGRERARRAYVVDGREGSMSLIRVQQS